MSKFKLESQLIITEDATPTPPLPPALLYADHKHVSGEGVQRSEVFLALGLAHTRLQTASALSGCWGDREGASWPQIRSVAEQVGRGGEEGHVD